MTKTLVATPDPDPEDPFPDLYAPVTATVFPPTVEEVGEAGEVLNVLFNPSLSWSGLANVLEGKDAEGWALLRVVPVNSYESVAVFERWH